MQREEIEARYRGMGLITRYMVDEPGKIYQAHKHEGVYLFTLKGSAKIKLDDGEWQLVEPGQEIRIKDDQLHEAVAGPQGWKYIFAASAEEVKRQGL